MGDKKRFANVWDAIEDTPQEAASMSARSAALISFGEAAKRQDIAGIDVEQVVQAAEADAGHALPGLRESLAELKRGEYGGVHTPEQIMARRKP